MSSAPSGLDVVQILLVEDSPGDVKLTTIALQRAKVRNELHVARDGEEAMEYLHTAARTGKIPDLVLLDLNLPRKDGKQVLAEVKADDKLRRIPVVVLTTSTADADILRSYNLNAAAYIVKPVDFSKFIEVVQSLEGFWLEVVRFPPKPSAAADEGPDGT